jgi:hypothetical protein
MSRLEGIAALLGITTDAASNYTRQVRRQFDAAPSYAEIMRAMRKLSGRPSPQQVAAEIKQFRASRGDGGEQRTARRGARQGGAREGARSGPGRRQGRGEPASQSGRRRSDGGGASATGGRTRADKGGRSREGSPGGQSRRKSGA